MKKYLKEENLDVLAQTYEDLEDDSHVLHLWEPFDVNIDENYKFVEDGFLFSFLSHLIYVIGFPILFIIQKLFFGFKIYGINNSKSTYKIGKVTVSNHIHFIDCTMIAMTNILDKTYFTSLESNFKIPIVRKLIKLLHAIPIPKDIRYTKRFMKNIDFLLNNGKGVHFYPEGSLWPYYQKLRKFKNGAFSFAVRNNVPVIPYVFKFEKVTGIRKYIKKKPFIRLYILEPEFPNTNLNYKEAVNELKNRVHSKMEEAINK